MTHTPLFIRTLAGLLVICACDQHYREGAHPPPKPRRPTLPAGHPPVSTARRPSDAPGGKTVSGTIRIRPELRSRIPDGAYLFIIARERADGGPPYALKRMRMPALPYHYTLTQSDVARMFGDGIVLAEIPEMYMVARIDRDGFAEVQPGDMEGACPKNPIAAGEQRADILIEQVH
ncbi:MAG: hypothetical protein OXU79_09785 [Gemmatimonadota bacterium]|nr:hypothetical protein [Gemmatimonadota bacterium]